MNMVVKACVFSYPSKTSKYSIYVLYFLYSTRMPKSIIHYQILSGVVKSKFKCRTDVFSALSFKLCQVLYLLTVKEMCRPLISPNSLRDNLTQLLPCKVFNFQLKAVRVIWPLSFHVQSDFVWTLFWQIIKLVNFWSCCFWIIIISSVPLWLGCFH